MRLPLATNTAKPEMPTVSPPTQLAPELMSPDLAAKIAAIGRVIDPAATAALYAPLHDREPYAGVTVTRDIAYGPAERQRLDVFQADGAADARPVLIFVHGGGFTGGNKSTPGSPFYDNVPLWAARNGLVGVNMTYPLAPEAVWPSASENIARVVRWVRENIAAYGGDPSRIFLFGHSAGATHAATFAAFPHIHGDAGTQLAGLILMSGIYDIAAFPLAPNYQAYVGEDESLYEARSALPGLLASRTPMMIVAAELEPPPFIAQFEQLTGALAQTPGANARTLLVPQHGHISIGYAIGTDDTRLTGAILDFIKAQS
jgi:triacylglycerol lipase